MKWKPIAMTCLLLAALAGGAAATYWYLNHVGGAALAGTEAAESKPAAQSEPAKEGKEAKGEKDAKGEKEEKDDAEGKGEKEEPPVAKVQVAPLRMEKIDEAVTAFGTVQAAAEEVQILNVQFECRVQRLSVVSGQNVEPDQALRRSSRAPTPGSSASRPAWTSSRPRCCWAWPASGRR